MSINLTIVHIFTYQIKTVCICVQTHEGGDTINSDTIFSFYLNVHELVLLSYYIATLKYSPTILMRSISSGFERRMFSVAPRTSSGM